ncbi:hypothetical protein SHELI_v1c10360 [Spiroplasma helicoides]|uniref:Lipoprotein n=1 Tax=Spiroplasma helicoides TaxID=216938 RepID=A0A1B3SM29_9MOLU|nr:hypothetical protein [Spiroplasma helicoides]AOG60983.1 hypothetical protein SHELI_v1c10360 [Spiroplasma helicoides]
MNRYTKFISSFFLSSMVVSSSSSVASCQNEKYKNATSVSIRPADEVVDLQFNDGKGYSDLIGLLTYSTTKIYQSDDWQKNLPLQLEDDKVLGTDYKNTEKQDYSNKGWDEEWQEEYEDHFILGPHDGSKIYTTFSNGNVNFTPIADEFVSIFKGINRLKSSFADNDYRYYLFTISGNKGNSKFDLYIYQLIEYFDNDQNAYIGQYYKRFQFKADLKYFTQ